MHDRLRIMAEFNDTDIGSLGARLLEKAICGEFHEFTLLGERMVRSGIVRHGNGASRNRAERPDEERE